MTTTIYHNPNCGTSRNVLALIRNSGEEPTVVEYLKTPPSRERLVALIAAMGIPVRELLLRKGTPYDELGIDDTRFSDDELIDLMLQHPILINRPIVQTPLGTRLCRPSEAVLEILPATTTRFSPTSATWCSYRMLQRWRNGPCRSPCGRRLGPFRERCW